MANYAINGFGRIGRNVLRAMTQKQVERVLAISDLTDTHTLAHLLKWDSVHGKFDGEIAYDEENIIVRGHKIRILKERDPANLPWKKLEVDVVLESTGLFTSRGKAELHLSKAGAKRVLSSAPAKDPDVTICVGVNDNVFDPGKDNIVSTARCTTTTRQLTPSMLRSRKLHQPKAIKASSNTVTNRLCPRTSLAIRTPAFSTAS